LDFISTYNVILQTNKNLWHRYDYGFAAHIGFRRRNNKNIIQRDRPFIKHSFDVIINHPISYSFPSGHTASSFTVLGIFYLV
jgi:PAP2 superfamily.